jgi:hypothetical protein
MVPDEEIAENSGWQGVNFNARLGPVHTNFAPAARPIRDAAREAGRAAVRAQQADRDKGMRPNRPAPPGCCEKARLRRCAAWQGMALAGATRLASIAFSQQRRREISVSRP